MTYKVTMVNPQHFVFTEMEEDEIFTVTNIRYEAGHLCLSFNNYKTNRCISSSSPSSKKNYCRIVLDFLNDPAVEGSRRSMFAALYAFELDNEPIVFPDDFVIIGKN